TASVLPWLAVRGGQAGPAEPRPSGSGECCRSLTVAALSALLALRSPLEKIVCQDGRPAPADLLAVVRPRPLPPVAEAARFRHQQVEQGIAVGAAVAIDRPAIEGLVELGAELVHGRQHVLIAAHPTDVVRPGTTLQRKVRLFPADGGDGL